MLLYTKMSKHLNSLIVISIIILTSLSFSLYLNSTQAYQDNLFTRIDDIELKEVHHQTPQTRYSFSYEIEIWNELDSFELSSDSLNLPVDSCIIWFNISTTNEISPDNFCLKQVDEEAINYSGGIVPMWGYFQSLTRDGLHNESMYPDGNITFSFYITEPKVADIVGDTYGFMIEVIDGEVNIIYDELPENYGDVTNKDANFLHFRAKDLKIFPIDLYNYTYTYFHFAVKGEFLNTGRALDYPPFATCGAILEGTASLELYKSERIISGNVCIDMVVPGSYPARSRSVIQSGFSLYYEDAILDTVTDGNMTIWFEHKQSETNTYKGRIISLNGELTYEIDDRPDYWDDYPVVDPKDYEWKTNPFRLNASLFYSILLIFLIPKNKNTLRKN
jgi:hypothetical protein